MLHYQWGTEIAVLCKCSNVSIITLVTWKGKGKACLSQRRWWEESVTSSIILPQGIRGQDLSGMNSHPHINWVQCLIEIVFLLPWKYLVSKNFIHTVAFLFLSNSLCFTVQWKTLECPISRPLTLYLWQFPVSALWRCHFPPSWGKYRSVMS